VLRPPAVAAMALASPRPLGTQAPGRTLVASSAKFRPQSRIGKKLIPIPKEVEVQLSGRSLTVKVRRSSTCPPARVR
jgi:hypothetical protein